MKKNLFNTDKKSNKNYALLNGLIVDIENSKFIKGTILIKDRLIEDFGSHIKSSEISNFFQVSWSAFAKTGSPSSQLMDWDVYENSSSITYINSKPEIKTFKNKDRIKLLYESKLES